MRSYIALIVWVAVSMGLISSGVLIGSAQHRVTHIAREPDIYSTRSPDSRIQYAVARGLLDGYGGADVRLIITDAPCGSTAYNGCVNRRSSLADVVQLNSHLDYPFIAKTVSHEFAHDNSNDQQSTAPSRKDLTDRYRRSGGAFTLPVLPLANDSESE